MIAPGKGILLIADPFLQDPNFLRTVVCLCEHGEEGTVGFVLNKKMNINLSEYVPELEGIDVTVYEGGPVQKNTLHFLHAYPDLIPGSLEVCKNVYWGGNFETLLILLKNRDLDLAKIKLFMGYSGWSPGQLDDEMKERSWLTVEATHTLVMKETYDQVWKQSLKQLGGKYEQLIHYPLDPQLN